jgi:hypothetical protein
MGGVVCDELGVSDFERLRSALARGGSRVTFLYAFDLIELDGQDLRTHPWDDRRVALARLLRDCPDGLRLSEHTSRAATAQRCSSMPAPWDWKAEPRRERLVASKPLCRGASADREESRVSSTKRRKRMRLAAATS